MEVVVESEGLYSIKGGGGCEMGKEKKLLRENDKCKLSSWCNIFLSLIMNKCLEPSRFELTLQYC